MLSELSTLQLGQVNEYTVNSIVERRGDTQRLTAKCENMLMYMNLSSYTLLKNVYPIIWNCTVQSLQLGILSYSGAHIQRFDLNLIASEVASFQLPVNISYDHDRLREISSRCKPTVVKLRRRQLERLNQLLGGCQPWVFHESFDSEDNEPLHLSTSIESLTDLWPPTWKILRGSEPGYIQQYDIGNGSIVPWSQNGEHSSNYCTTKPSEVYCHWISSKNWNDLIVEEHQMWVARKYLLESDILLIGANTEFGLNVNPDCSSSLERLSRIRTQLDDQGALCIPKTFRARRYIDSQAVQVSGTACGIISGTGVITYKRLVGHTMKDSLVERWRHNLWSPLDLEAFSGVGVSFCTRNARRRRLMHY